MVYILGTNLKSNQLVHKSLTSIFGIGSAKALQICQQLGISEAVKVNQLSKIQLDKIVQIVNQNSLIDSELKRTIQRDVKRLISIGCYRGFRHTLGLPLRGQRTSTNAKTSRRTKQ